MAMKLERVKVADIRPLEDEYGNQFASRDYDLKANKEYVSELAASFDASGEPEEPVRLIRDGKLYRIKTGNSRVRAMKQLGTEECWALIDDDDTVQSVLEATVRTDHKKKYEETELAGYVQQLTMFGDDEYVSDVSGIGVENARKVRRVREIAGEAAENMTLDRMYAAYEFDGDDEKFEEIMSAPEGKWRSIADHYIGERDRKLKVEALEAASIAAGLRLTADARQGRQYITSVEKPESMADEVAGASEGYTDVVGIVSDYSWRPAITLYGVSKTKDEEDRKAAEERRKREEAESACEAAIDAREAWFMAKVRNNEPMPVVDGMLRDAFMNHATTSDYNAASIGDALDIVAEADDGQRIDETMNQLCKFVAWWWLPAQKFSTGYAGAVADGNFGYYKVMMKEFVGLGAAMRQDGYEPNEAEEWITDLVSSALAEDGNDGDSDDE